jgi:predicted kinase
MVAAGGSRSRPPSLEVALKPRKRRWVPSVSEELHTSAAGGDVSERPHALFLMGLPGAGKTTVKRRRLHRGDLDIEPDRFKRRHPRYSHEMSEETDDEVHRWSVRRAVDAFEDAIASRRQRNLVFDSSGSNARWLARRIVAARHAGYRTELLWVDVPLEVALLRNRDRDQWCPEKIIFDKAQVLPKSFEELRREVDSSER